MEMIVCAAVRWWNQEGGQVIVWGWRKNLTNMHHLVRDYLIVQNPKHGSTLFKKADQGFLTSQGRFVSRELGLDIAIRANQIIHKHPDYAELYSEDLRSCVVKDHLGCREWSKHDDV